ncbi:MAG: sigma-70 family RNA polymerase sigma factor [Bacteroidales bacterium]|nr:sigma-70 family RNA polymerase sigma factor [Bacteroidales bacterium]
MDSIEKLERYNDFMGRFSRHVENYCIDHSGSREEALDLMQEVRMRIWTSLDGFEGRSGGEENNWLKMVMRSAVTDFYRRDRHVDTVRIESVEVAAEEDCWAELRDMLQWLEVAERELVEERLSGLSSEEMGQRHGITANNVNQKMFRIIKKLKEIYEKYYGE